MLIFSIQSLNVFTFGVPLNSGKNFGVLWVIKGCRALLCTKKGSWELHQLHTMPRELYITCLAYNKY